MAEQNYVRGQEVEIQQDNGTVIVVEWNPCVRCKKNIVGELVEVGEAAYHPECFTCSECGCSLMEEEEYEEEDGDVFCVDCAKEILNPRCYYCKQPITDTAIAFNNRKYHTNHFGCSMCKLNLKGKEYRDVDGDPYCLDCSKQKIAAKEQKELCFKCQEPILGDFIIINGMKCHPEHFQCPICHCEFTGGSSVEFMGKRYCKQCYKTVSVAVCEKCKQPITGRSIQACGFIYHPNCLTCTECDLPLTSASFLEYNGKPYCDFHYYRMFGHLCDKCGETVKDNDAIVVADKYFHPQCFVCNMCNKKLDPKRTKLYENSPICPSCYGRLPSDVRYQIEREEEELKEVDKKREKDRKKEEKERKKAEKKKEKELKEQMKKAKAKK